MYYLSTAILSSFAPSSLPGACHLGLSHRPFSPFTFHGRDREAVGILPSSVLRTRPRSLAFLASSHFSPSQNNWSGHGPFYSPHPWVGKALETCSTSYHFKSWVKFCTILNILMPPKINGIFWDRVWGFTHRKTPYDIIINSNITIFLWLFG